MKRIQHYFLAILIVLSMMLLSACGQSGQPTDPSIPSKTTDQSIPTKSSDRSETDPSHSAAESSESSTSPESPSSSASSSADSPIPDRRIGVVRTGDYITQTEQGIYTVVTEKVTESGYGYMTFVLYCDHYSDEFVKLCGRVDCPHNTAECDACLGRCVPLLGYFNGHLYYIQQRNQANAATNTLCRMDPDGRNKTTVLSLFPDSQEGKQNIGIADPEFFNGYFKVGLQKLNEDGIVKYEICYCSLDDPSSLKPTALELKHPMSELQSIQFSNGDSILVGDQFDGDQTKDDQGVLIYEFLYAWDPASNNLEPVGDRKTDGGGYYDRSGGYLIEEGKICRWHYEDRSAEPVFDTGLEGNLFLYCYPDCLVVSESRAADEEETDTVSLWFYDWDFNSLGECRVVFDRASWYPSVIVGETENRIILGDPFRIEYPLWYIEKSDFGTGNIALHEYHYPEMDLLE